MLTIVVPGVEMFNSELEEFVTTETIELELEHSLVSLSKWESIHEKPFLGPQERTTEEVVSYIECMIQNPKNSPGVIDRLSSENVEAIRQYIDAKRSATWFNEPQNSSRSREVITSELIYYWMLTFNIPFECQNWHLNRLFTLIRIYALKNSKQTRMSRSEVAARNRSLNAQRKAELGTTG